MPQPSLEHENWCTTAKFDNLRSQIRQGPVSPPNVAPGDPVHAGATITALAYRCRYLLRRQQRDRVPDFPGLSPWWTSQEFVAYISKA